MDKFKRLIEKLGGTLEAPTEGTVKAKIRFGDRSLKAVWSPEVVKDLKAFHGIDAEKEIAFAVAQEVIVELIRNSPLRMALESVKATEALYEFAGKLVNIIGTEP